LSKKNTEKSSKFTDRKGAYQNQTSRLQDSLEKGLKVCVDLQFEELMNEKELNHLANQLKRVYSSNKASV